MPYTCYIQVLVFEREQERLAISCAHCVPARRNTPLYLTVTPTKWFCPQTFVDLLQRASLVPAQTEDNCTVGEVEEGTTLVGFPDDDVCVAAS